MPEFTTPPDAPGDAPEAPLEDPAAAFAALAEEVRLEILLALATGEDGDRPIDEATDPNARPARSFSELKRRTGVRDSGRFNYHLQRLQPRFVATTDGGYRLRDAGLAVAALVVDDTSINATVDEAPIPR